MLLAYYAIIYNSTQDEIKVTKEIKVEKIVKEVTPKLKEYKTSYDEETSKLSEIFILMFVSGAFIMFILFIRVWKNISSQEKYEAKLSEFNALLESQVAEKTKEIVIKNNWLEAIYNNTSALICELSLEEKIVTLNKGNDIHKPEFFIGKTISEIFDENYTCKIRQTIEKVVEKKKPYNFEYIYYNKDGKAEYYAGVYAPIINDNKVTSILLTALDISNLKEADEKIKNMNNELAEMAGSMSHIKESERNEIAREIHDELGQGLTVLKMNGAWLKNNLVSVNQEVQNKLDELLVAITNTIETNRRLLNTLNPEILDQRGLYESLEWHIQAFTKSTNIYANLNASRQLNFVKQINLSVYRIVQESLTNIIRYSKATDVFIDVVLIDSILNIKVADNGIGFDTNKIDTMKSHGLKGMRERVMALNGTIKISSILNEGTTIEVTIPNAVITPIVSNL